MLPSSARVTRLSGSGRSSADSQKSTARSATSSSANVGASRVSSGFSPRYIGRRGLADHLHVAHRVVEVVVAEVVVVEAERLLEPGVVLLRRDGQERTAVVEHVVAPDLVRAVGQAVRVLVVGAGQQQLGGVRRAGRDDDHRAGEPLLLAVDLGDDRCHASARTRRSPAVVPAALRSSVTLSCRSAGRTAITSASDLACTRHGKPVAGGAPDARAEGRLGLVEHDAARRVERVQPDPGQVVEQPLDPRLVRHRRERVRRRSRWLGRVLAADAVHLVELLGLRVVRLEHVVADRPGGRDPAVVLQLAEVLLAQPVQRGAVELGRAADEVVDLRLERRCRSRRTRCPARRSGCRRRPPSASQFSISRGSQSPRSRIRTRLPDGASRCASVPPPAPDPTMMTS